MCRRFFTLVRALLPSAALVAPSFPVFQMAHGQAESEAQALALALEADREAVARAHTEAEAAVAAVTAAAASAAKAKAAAAAGAEAEAEAAPADAAAARWEGFRIALAATAGERPLFAGGPRSSCLFDDGSDDDDSGQCQTKVPRVGGRLPSPPSPPSPSNPAHPA